jgi:Ca-activated chloride channel family protein
MTLSPFIKANSQRLRDLSLLTFLVLFAGLLSVQAQDDDTLRTETTVVQLNVGVVNKQGRAVTNLSRDDFSIFEDGVKQTIQSFEPTEAPISLVLLLDMSGSTINFRQQIQVAAIRFLDALKPDDRVAVIQFNSKGVKSLLVFTSDRRKVAYAITLASGGGTPSLIFDALKVSLKELAKEGKRRKAIVALTDGIDTPSHKLDTRAVSRVQTDAEISVAIRPENSPQLNAVLNEADRQGVTIFPLALPSGDPKHLPLLDAAIIAKYAAARTRMQMLADRTGGHLNEINSLSEMAKIYVEVAASLRTLYTVAYQAPGRHARDGKWHEIRIEVNYPELIARTRPGYYAR